MDGVHRLSIDSETLPSGSTRTQTSDCGLPLLDESLTFTYDHRINSAVAIIILPNPVCMDRDGEHEIVYADDFAAERAARLALQTVISNVWTTAARNGDVLEILEREFPPV